MSLEYRRLLLDSKMIRGGRAAARARIGGALAAQQALPSRRQNPRLLTRLKRADRKLAKRGKAGAAAKFDKWGARRPRTLAQMREWNDAAISIARRRAKSREINRLTGGNSAETHRDRRLFQRAQARGRILEAWERTKRPPTHFRVGGETSKRRKQRLQGVLARRTQRILDDRVAALIRAGG